MDNLKQLDEVDEVKELQDLQEVDFEENNMELVEKVAQPQAVGEWLWLSRDGYQWWQWQWLATRDGCELWRFQAVAEYALNLPSIDRRKGK